MYLGKTLAGFSAAILIACFSTSYAAPGSWPLKGEIDLSSGFGDYRSGRFHAGLDLRTGGAPGKEMFSPVDGYISRIRMSYTGYGKGLYLTGNDGYLYVFGHLQGFNPTLEKLVRGRQMEAKRYYVEIDLPPDSVKFKRGDLLGYTGQTGAGAPHLHFEKRTMGNVPLNPLTHGFPLKEKVRPVFTRIGFQLTDDHSLLSDGTRKMFLEAKPAGKSGGYRLDTVLYFNAPFGVLADCYDRMRDGGMRQAVYTLQLYIDQTLYYQVVMDSSDYSTTDAANLVYDFSEATDGEPRVRRLFHQVGNEFAGSLKFGAHLGIVGNDDNLSFGKHAVRVLAEDAFGNRSETNFSFIWGPPGDLYALDSAKAISDTAMQYHFTATDAALNLPIDSIEVYMNRGVRWGVPPTIKVRRIDRTRIVADAIGYDQRQLVFRLVYTTKEKCRMWDLPFNGVMHRGIFPPAVSHELVEDGMIVRGELTGRVAYQAEIELYHRDSLLGTERMSRFFNMDKYAVFVPSRPQYDAIDRIVFRFKSELPSTPGIEDGLTIVRVGQRDSVRIAVDTLFEVNADMADFYAPRLVELKRTKIVNRSALKMASDHYELIPEDVLVKGLLDLTFRTIPSGYKEKQLGLCWLDKQENRWVWVQSKVDTPTVLNGTTRGGGSFGAIFDFDPPTIAGLNVAAQQTIRDLSPKFTFKLTDDLSGIEDDRSIVIKLDGQWQIPEYDPEAGVCQVVPDGPMKVGEHHLSIEIVDRAGNQAQQYLKFKIAAPLPPKQKRP
jgi:hypothetical protein